MKLPAGTKAGPAIDQQLGFLDFGPESRAALRGLKPLIDRELPHALDVLYTQIQSTPEARRHFRDDAHMQSAKGRQLAHWGRIVSGDFGAEFAGSVHNVGQTHARIGLEPSWYINGYALILTDLFKATVRAHWPKGMFGNGRAGADALGEALGALVKAAMLDMNIAISTYLEASEAERLKSEEARVTAAEHQEVVVDAMSEGLAKLSDGDLTYRMRQAFPEEYLELQKEFNLTMDNMHEVMAFISANASGMFAGAGEITQAADDLSRRTEQQAASLEETAAALDEITATVKRTAEGANKASNVVATAKSDAEVSGQVVRSAVSAMSEIDKSATEITQIIGVIDEIAFQTNLLALNAGVEAARAGDAGKGFAVVASEVRALAQRSAEAAKEIKGLISTSSSQVKTGVDLVGKTGDALQRIMTQVAEISGLMTEIASSAQEQSTGLSQVNTAVNQMDQMTQQNAAMVEESTAASHALANEAKELSQLVARFRLAEGAGAANTAGRPKGRGRAVAQMKTTGSSAVRKAAPDSWEEF